MVFILLLIICCLFSDCTGQLSVYTQRMNGAAVNPKKEFLEAEN
jgi:hypothetical protein